MAGARAQPSPPAQLRKAAPRRGCPVKTTPSASESTGWRPRARREPTIAPPLGSLRLTRSPPWGRPTAALTGNTALAPVRSLCRLPSCLRLHAEGHKAATGTGERPALRDRNTPQNGADSRGVRTLLENTEDALSASPPRGGAGARPPSAQAPGAGLQRGGGGGGRPPCWPRLRSDSYPVCRGWHCFLRFVTTL